LLSLWLLLLGPEAVSACTTLSNRLTRIESQDGIPLRGRLTRIESQDGIPLRGRFLHKLTLAPISSLPPLKIWLLSGGFSTTAVGSRGKQPPHHHHRSIPAPCCYLIHPRCHHSDPPRLPSPAIPTVSRHPQPTSSPPHCRAPRHQPSPPSTSRHHHHDNHLIIIVTSAANTTSPPPQPRHHHKGACGFNPPQRRVHLVLRGMGYGLCLKLPKSAKNQTISTHDQKPQDKAGPGSNF
nr:hypothetical protein [Tanacetum cinerariifolium]